MFNGNRPAKVKTAGKQLRHLVRAHGLELSQLSARPAWEIFLEFATIPFAVPSQPDADGLLYQIGSYTFSGEPRFHFDPVRQFAVADEDEYVQVGLSLEFELNADLAALDKHNQWWFADNETPLASWIESIENRPEWSLLDGLSPVHVEISQNWT